MKEEKYPQPGEIVMVKLREIAEIGVYSSLLEYGGIEGLIIPSEVTRRRVRSLRQVVRVGQECAATVLRVDEARGYVDLSLKAQIRPDTLARVEEEWSMSKRAHSVLKTAASRAKCDWGMSLVYSRIAWPLAREYGHAWKGIEALVQGDDNARAILSQVPENILDSLSTTARDRINMGPIKVEKQVEASCFQRGGVNSLKAAFSNVIESTSSIEYDVSIAVLAPPLYQVVVTGFGSEAELGAVLDRACKQLALEIQIAGVEETVRHE